MLNDEKVRSIIDECKILGANVRVRDIAYILLSQKMEKVLAYQCLFGTTEGIESYEQSAEVSILADYMKRATITGTTMKADDGEGITFEENRKAMEQLLKQTQQAMDEGLMEPKDGLKIQADIRVKLNDKFNVQSQDNERHIYVEKKYNHICERYHCECYLPTVEDLKEMYNLIENPNQK